MDLYAGIAGTAYRGQSHPGFELLISAVGANNLQSGGRGIIVHWTSIEERNAKIQLDDRQPSPAPQWCRGDTKLRFF
jgi:hypothetical protein